MMMSATKIRYAMHLLNEREKLTDIKKQLTKADRFEFRFGYVMVDGREWQDLVIRNVDIKTLLITDIDAQIADVDEKMRKHGVEPPTEAAS